MSSAVDTATEIVADAAEEVAEQATNLANTSRGLSGRGFGLAFGGFAVGAGLSGSLVFIFVRRQLEEKYNQIAEDEIAEMREHYHSKVVALENTVDKPKLADLVREQKYSSDSEPPMAVTPPSAVVEAAEAAQEEERTQVKPPVPVEPKEQNVFQREPIPEEELGEPTRVADSNWDYAREKQRRSPVKPYVIHIDEREESQTHGYDELTFTYYEEDDVLCNERDEVIGKPERDVLVGEANLEKFGHGSGDSSIVYVRNDKEEMVIEVVRSPNSYAEEVHGFQHSESLSRRHHRGRTFRDDE